MVISFSSWIIVTIFYRQNFASQTLNTNKVNQDEPKQTTFSKIDAKSECDMKSRLLNRNRIGSTPAAPNPLPKFTIKEKMFVKMF
jgi:hypothetical protein